MTNEMKSLTLDGTKYDSFVDETARTTANEAKEIAQAASENGTGADGVTPNFTIGTVTTLEAGSDATVELEAKTETDFKFNFGIPKGADGKDGENGTDGAKGTSVTVSSVEESTADGGSNVVTFSDGNTLTVKNGSKGSQGKNGYTPVKGTDYWTDEDRAGIVAESTAALSNKVIQQVYAPSPQLPADGRKIGTTAGGELAPNFTNLLDNAEITVGYRLSQSANTFKACEGCDAVIFAIMQGSSNILRLRNCSYHTTTSVYAEPYFSADKTTWNYEETGSITGDWYTDDNGDLCLPFTNTLYSYICLNMNTVDTSAAIITLNEEITYIETEGETVTVNADFDGENITPTDIYDYMDALVGKFPAYITKEVLGKDESGTFDWCRYVCCRKTYNAWQKVNYPAMYAWVSGSTTIYSVSVSPRIDDTVYSTAYIGTAYSTVTAVDNANQTRTINGLVFTRDETKDVEPSLVYTSAVYRPNHSVYWFGSEKTTRILDKNMSSLGDIATYTTEAITDASGNTYNRYPLGDKDENFEDFATIVIGANEHGGQQNGDSAEPAIVTARMAKDLCECANANNPFLNLLKSNYMIVLCPIINPYGFGKTSGYTNANGVNIDRNFDTPGWGNDTDTRHGEYGGSENETQYFMNTLVASKAKIAMANHSLGYTSDTAGNPLYMGVCAYMLSAERDKYANHIKSIRSVMNVNYDLLMHNMGEAPPETYAKTRSYIDYVGIEGVAVEMAVSDGTEVGGVGALHTEKILEADYTLLLQFLNMLIECHE